MNLSNYDLAKNNLEKVQKIEVDRIFFTVIEDCEGMTIRQTKKRIGNFLKENDLPSEIKRAIRERMHHYVEDLKVNGIEDIENESEGSYKKQRTAIQQLGVSVAKKIFDEAKRNSKTLKEFNTKVDEIMKKEFGGTGIQFPVGSLVNLYIRELKETMGVEIKEANDHVKNQVEANKKVKDVTVGLGVTNSEEFKKLFEKATNQSEQLQETLSEINNFELKIQVS